MFYDLKSLLRKNISQAGIRKQVDAVNIVTLFNNLSPRALGERLARETQALFVRDGILTLQCTSSVVMQEVRYRERSLLSALNKAAGREAVKKVRYTT
jgi:predicted nucleic acid-binding Zn ribbon protein